MSWDPALVSGSKLHRIWKCPASAILPRTINDEHEARTEPFRNQGKEVHKFLERVRSVGVDAALAGLSPEVRTLCMALELDKLPAHLSTEVAFAWNWRTRSARELGRNLGHRDYYNLPEPPTDEEFPLTLDAIGVEGKRGYVGDYKKGHTKYPRPGRFAQTLIGACALRQLFDLDDVVVELIYINDAGESFPCRDIVDSWTLDPFEDEIQTILDGMSALEADWMAGRALPKHEGPHCDHCPAFKVCDAKTALIRAVPQELMRLGVREGKPGELDIEPGAITVRNAAAVFEAAERIMAIMRRVKDEVCGLAYHEPITLSDGRVIERYQTSRRHVDGKTAAAVLEQLYGRDQAMKAVDLKVSIEAIRDLVVENMDQLAKPRPKIETKKKDGLLDLVLAEIERRGGLAVDVGEECKPRQPRKPRAAKK
jgi:hypothetical protein